jgi:hypothetical protein
LPAATGFKAAVSRARQKLKAKGLALLIDTLSDLVHTELAQQLRHDLRVFAADESTARLPDTPAIREHLGGPQSSGVKMVRFSRIYDVLSAPTWTRLRRENLIWLLTVY